MPVKQKQNEITVVVVVCVEAKLNFNIMRLTNISVQMYNNMQ